MVRTADICQSVQSGDLHFSLRKYVRNDLLGIDYSKVPSIIKYEKEKADGGRAQETQDWSMSAEEKLQRTHQLDSQDTEEQQMRHDVHY